MSNTNNLVAQYYLAYHENNVDRAANILAGAYSGEINGEKVSRKEEIESIGAFIEAFPNIKFTIHDSFQDGNKIVTRWTCTGSHWGNFAGYEPTERQVTIRGMTIFEVNKTHVEKIWTNYDLLSLLRQLED